MGRLSRLYPFVFLVLPLLSAVNRHPGQTAIGDLAITSVALLAAGAVVYTLLVFALPASKRGDLPPLVLLVLVLWFYAYPRLFDWISERTGVSVIALMLLASAFTAAGCWTLARRPRLLEVATRFLMLTGALAGGWSTVGILLDQVRAEDAIHQSALARDLSRAIPVGGPSAWGRMAARRDIYLILLDEHASGQVLDRHFGYDHRIFEDSLRRLGFTIPQVVRSNYAYTLLSLPSLLNFSYVTRLAGELGTESKDPTLLNFLLENNRTVAFLERQGYQFVFVPSGWWLATSHNRHADVQVGIWQGHDIARVLTCTYFRRIWTDITALKLLHIDFRGDVPYIRNTFAVLKRLGGRGATPKFVFAHVLSPHGPDVFGPGCRPSRDVLARARGAKVAYINQVECVDSLVLDLVTSLLRTSPVPPIILLQGDHGSVTQLEASPPRTARAVSRSQAWERFNTFGAYYVPDAGDTMFTRHVTVVNVLRNVLVHYFGAQLPRAPDTSYFSLDGRPYDFVRIDPRWLESP